LTRRLEESLVRTPRLSVGLEDGWAEINLDDTRRPWSPDEPTVPDLTAFVAGAQAGPAELRRDRFEAHIAVPRFLERLPATRLRDGKSSLLRSGLPIRVNL
jgi:hypothetical protein